ncbi:MAG: hypothetical protein U1E01_12155, partial [Methylicorpusculum sp.]
QDAVSRGLAPRQGRAYREIFQLVRDHLAGGDDIPEPEPIAPAAPFLSACTAKSCPSACAPETATKISPGCNVRVSIEKFICAGNSLARKETPGTASITNRSSNCIDHPRYFTHQTYFGFFYICIVEGKHLLFVFVCQEFALYSSKSIRSKNINNFHQIKISPLSDTTFIVVFFTLLLFQTAINE